MRRKASCKLKELEGVKKLKRNPDSKFSNGYLTSLFPEALQDTGSCSGDEFLVPHSLPMFTFQLWNTHSSSQVTVDFPVWKGGMQIS